MQPVLIEAPPEQVTIQFQTGDGKALQTGQHGSALGGGPGCQAGVSSQTGCSTETSRVRPVFVGPTRRLVRERCTCATPATRSRSPR
jgi:hypothetical protein